MDHQQIINIAFGLAGSLGGFILKATWDALNAMRTDLQSLQNAIASTYVRKDDFHHAADEIKSMLRRIEDKLDGKVDKP